jgi:ubiquinone/menaquinone biosynthesis C-methylase UbiE
MGLYQDWVVPTLTDLSMRNKRLRPYRERVAGAAQGRVLDVGVGSGLNLPLYGQAREVFGLDPSSRLLTWAQNQAQHTRVPIHLLEGSAECIPLADGSMDTVVMTWTGCSIPDVRVALREMRRVLSPGGCLLFVEHGRAPEPGVARWQELLDPLWVRFSGGCHLSRKIDDLLAVAGFRVERLRTGYVPGPRIMTFLYEGVARPR